MARAKTAPIFLCALLLALPAFRGLAADGETIDIAPAAKDLDVVRELLRTHFTQLPGELLEQAALEGLLAKLGGRARVVPAEVGEPASPPAVVLATNRFESGVVQLRVGAVAEGLSRALKDLAVAGETRAGLVLDLRNATGNDWRAAGAVADLFDDTTAPLLRWGSEAYEGTVEAPLAGARVVVLMNKRTAGAAEALAELLRRKAGAVLIGGGTAGETLGRKRFPLPSGSLLELAMEPVFLAGESSLPPDGIRPDIAVESPRERENFWLENPYWLPPARDGVAQRRGPVMNEAELMRRHRGETNGPAPAPVAAAVPAGEPGGNRAVADPALARALDLLKGVRILARGPAEPQR